MYPFIYIAHNMGHESMIGKLLIEGFEDLNWDPTDNIYDAGKMFIEAVLSKDYSYIGKSYFGLPSGEELIEMIG